MHVVKQVLAHCPSWGGNQASGSGGTLSSAMRGFIFTCWTGAVGSFRAGRLPSNNGSLFFSFFKVISFLQLINTYKICNTSKKKYNGHEIPQNVQFH